MVGGPLRKWTDRRGPPHHFPKAHALRYGHRKFGSDWMYIRGEWALRRWHWIKFLGYQKLDSGVPAGVLRVISCVILTYTRTFSNREPIPFSKAHALSYTKMVGGPELYEQQSWEWSDAYSWRNDLWKVNFKRVCEKPAGVLMVIWSGFLAPIRSFSKVAPILHQMWKIAPILHQIWKIAPILHQIWKYRYKSPIIIAFML